MNIKEDYETLDLDELELNPPRKLAPSFSSSSLFSNLKSNADLDSASSQDASSQYFLKRKFRLISDYKAPQVSLSSNSSLANATLPTTSSKATPVPTASSAARQHGPIKKRASLFNVNQQKSSPTPHHHFHRSLSLKSSRSSSPSSPSSTSSSTSSSIASSLNSLPSNQQINIFVNLTLQFTSSSSPPSHSDSTHGNNNPSTGSKVSAGLPHFYPRDFFQNFKSYLLETQPFDVCLRLGSPDDENETSDLEELEKNNITKPVIYAHKIILMNSSSYLRQKINSAQAELLSNSTRRREDDIVLKVKLDEITDYESLKWCIEYMYSCGALISPLKIRLDRLRQIKRTVQVLGLSDLHNSLTALNKLVVKKEKQKKKEVKINEEEELKKTKQVSAAAVTAMGGDGALQSNNSPTNPGLQKYFDLLMMNQQLNAFKYFMLGNTWPNNNNMSNSNDSIATTSTANVDSVNKVVQNGSYLFENESMLAKVSEYIQDEIMNSRSVEFNIDTITRDFFMKDKYIYPSQEGDEEANLMVNLENVSIIRLGDEEYNQKRVQQHHHQNALSHGEFYRHSYIVFCVSIGPSEQFKFNNFLIKAQLKFADVDVLRENIRERLEMFCNGYLLEKLRASCNANGVYSSIQFGVTVSRICFLKKPSNCRTVRLESIKNSTDCFRAVVEYSRKKPVMTFAGDDNHLLPYVFITAHANVSIRRI